MSSNQNSKMIKAGARTYFFDKKVSKNGNQYLVITESKFKKEDKSSERTSILVFPDHSKEFLDVLKSMVDVL